MANVTASFHAGRDLEAQLAERGWQVESTGDGVTARQGSELRMRTLGGWFVGFDKLPKRLVAAKSGDGYDVTVEKKMTFGWTDPLLTSRYEKAFEELEHDLSA